MANSAPADEPINGSSRRRSIRGSSRGRSAEKEEVVPSRRSRRLSRGSSLEPSDSEDISTTTVNNKRDIVNKLEIIQEMKETPEKTVKSVDEESSGMRSPESSHSPSKPLKSPVKNISLDTSDKGVSDEPSPKEVASETSLEEKQTKHSDRNTSKSPSRSRSPKRRNSGSSRRTSGSPRVKYSKSPGKEDSVSPKRRSSASPRKSSSKPRSASRTPEPDNQNDIKTAPSSKEDSSDEAVKQKRAPIVLEGLDGEDKR